MYSDQSFTAHQAMNTLQSAQDDESLPCAWKYFASAALMICDCCGRLGWKRIPATALALLLYFRILSSTMGCDLTAARFDGSDVHNDKDFCISRQLSDLHVAVRDCLHLSP